MTAYVALLRAVNVGGTGKLPMADLCAIGETCGFTAVRTFIASGNLLFESNLGEAAVKALLEDQLEQYAGKRIAVLVRTAGELKAIIAADPFADAHPSRNLVYFYDTPLLEDFIANCRDVGGERLALGKRELYVDYGEGIRFTRLKIPKSGDATGRNINSVRRVSALLG